MAIQADDIPKAFISYSWDNPEHSAWVLGLARRLRRDGIDVVLDQWDAVLGGDLTLFMDQAGDERYRVIAICSERYVSKANAGEGGVGYERRVITQSLMNDLRSSRVVPLVRNNPDKRLPKFFGPARYADFTGVDTEKAYLELLMELHGVPPASKPPIGPNPFATTPRELTAIAIRHSPERYRSPALAATVTFEYENNDGRFTVGDGDREFTLMFTGAGYNSIHMYSDPDGIEAIALARNVADESDIDDAREYDWSSRSRMAHVGDAVLLRKKNGYVAAVFPQEVYVRDTGPTGDSLMTFRYVISETPAWPF